VIGDRRSQNHRLSMRRYRLSMIDGSSIADRRSSIAHHACGQPGFGEQTPIIGDR
jgi:hypothetical protein